MIKYLESKGYEFLGIEYGLVFYKDKEGKIWGSCEANFALTEMKSRQIM